CIPNFAHKLLSRLIIQANTSKTGGFCNGYYVINLYPHVSATQPGRCSEQSDRPSDGIGDQQSQCGHPAVIEIIAGTPRLGCPRQHEKNETECDGARHLNHLRPLLALGLAVQTSNARSPCPDVAAAPPTSLLTMT